MLYAVNGNGWFVGLCASTIRGDKVNATVKRITSIARQFRTERFLLMTPKRLRVCTLATSDGNDSKSDDLPVLFLEIRTLSIRIVRQ